MALTSMQAVSSWSVLPVCSEAIAQTRASTSCLRVAPCHLHAQSPSPPFPTTHKSIVVPHKRAACQHTPMTSALSSLAGRFSARTKVLKASRKFRSVRVHAAGDEDLPPELANDEDGKFAKINQGDPAYGPAALLLLGFTPEEKQDVKGLLDEIGGDFMKIVQATSDMLDGTLWDAFGRVQVQSPPNLAVDVPRMCFISGLTGEELMMLVDAFSKSKLRRPVFAALVPKNKDKLLRELIDEVMGDHRRLVIEGKQRLREQRAKANG